MDEQEYKDYKKLVERKRKLIVKNQNELQKLLNLCPHLEIQYNSKYYPGGYDYKAETHEWNECKLCKKKSEITITTHAFYS